MERTEAPGTAGVVIFLQEGVGLALLGDARAMRSIGRSEVNIVFENVNGINEGNFLESGSQPIES